MTVLAQTSRAPADPRESEAFFFTNTLNGPQKAAIIVRLLLAEGADLPLTALPDHLQAALTEQIGQMRTIDRDTLAAVVEEFCLTLEQVGLSFSGGIEDALRMLDGRISPAVATHLKRRIGASTKTDPWDTIRTIEVERLLPVVAVESPEVAAVILSKIAVPRAAEILGGLPGDRARQIAYTMSKTGEIAPDTVQRIGLSLVSQLEAVKVSAFESSPVERVGAILNVSPAITREDVLLGLDETDRVLAGEVRKTIFTFAHIPARILPRDVPKILKGVEQDQLARALGGAKGDATDAAEFILANMSQRLAASLREEIAQMGRVKEKDVEAAQTALVIAIRALEAEGELVMIVPEEEGE